jgi:hypothetical protein
MRVCSSVAQRRPPHSRRAGRAAAVKMSGTAEGMVSVEIGWNGVVAVGWEAPYG